MIDWVKLIAIGAIVAGIAWGVNAFLNYEQQIGYDRRVAEDNKALVKAQSDAAEEQARLTNQLEVARNEANEREKTIRTLSAHAGTAAAGLRSALDTIRSSLPSTTLEAARQRADTLAVVFGDCSDQYRRVAEKADRHASDARTLSDGWPK